MRLSVIIVNWNAGDLLRNCVRAVIADLDRSRLTESEIILVDNASSDGSVVRLGPEFPSVCRLQNAENLGFARATNQGIRQSKGQYVLLLNPDTEIMPGALGEMMQFMESNPCAGAVGARLLNGDGSLQVSAYPEPTLLREVWRLFHFDRLWPVGTYCMKVWRTDSAREVDVLMGACMLLRRDVLDLCGFLDERYFIYSEDQDLCRRLRSGGWRIFWLPQAKVTHYGGQSTRQAKADMFVHLYREKIAYFRIHHGPVSAGIYKIVLLGASVSRQILVPLALLCGREQRRRMFELTRCYRRLAKELPGF